MLQPMLYFTRAAQRRAGKSSQCVPPTLQRRLVPWMQFPRTFGSHGSSRPPWGTGWFRFATRWPQARFKPLMWGRPFPCRGLHSTQPRRNILIRWGAMFLGRFIRRRARKKLAHLSPQERRKVYAGISVFIGGGAGIAGTAYYYTHLGTTPITGRDRLVVSREREISVAHESSKTFAPKWKEQGVQILPPSDPVSERVRRICADLIVAIDHFREDLDQNVLDTMEWKVTVVDDPKQVNAFVLPNGEIYVYTGIVNFCGEGARGDAELAAIVGHEIAHALLRHGGERLSRHNLLLWTNAALQTVLWLWVPDVVADAGFRIAGILENFQTQIMQVLFARPYDREHEKEADYVGLLLSSAACYDPTCASAFWKRMAGDAEKSKRESSLEFLSTHPASARRSSNLKKWEDEAIRIGESVGCDRSKLRENKPCVRDEAKQMYKGLLRVSREAELKLAEKELRAAEDQLARVVADQKLQQTLLEGIVEETKKDSRDKAQEKAAKIIEEANNRVIAAKEKVKEAESELSKDKSEGLLKQVRSFF